MKKLYIEPEIEIIDIELSGMLCVSTLIGDDATEVANTPGLDWENWDEE